MKSSAQSYHDSQLSPEFRSKVSKKPNDVLNDACGLMVLEQMCEMYYHEENEEDELQESEAVIEVI